MIWVTAQQEQGMQNTKDIWGSRVDFLINRILWNGLQLSVQTWFSGNPFQSFHKIVEYLELEGSCKRNQVQTLFPHSANQNSNLVSESVVQMLLDLQQLRAVPTFPGSLLHAQHLLMQNLPLTPSLTVPQSSTVPFLPVLSSPESKTAGRHVASLQSALDQVTSTTPHTYGPLDPLLFSPPTFRCFLTILCTLCCPTLHTVLEVRPHIAEQNGTIASFAQLAVLAMVHPRAQLPLWAARAHCCPTVDEEVLGGSIGNEWTFESFLNGKHEKLHS